jgi:hypothetical protein
MMLLVLEKMRTLGITYYTPIKSILFLGWILQWSILAGSPQKKISIMLTKDLCRPDYAYELACRADLSISPSHTCRAFPLGSFYHILQEYKGATQMQLQGD